MKNSLFISLICLVICSCQSDEEIKRKQYFVEGLELYKTNCANCHQLDGAGLEGLYPPIDKDYLSQNKVKVICLIKNGGHDSLQINGKKYTQAMPANSKLEALEIAEITTFIYNKWGDESVITTIDEVKNAFEKCPK
jgi:mono/diheme cytochrome c family protein